MSLGLALGGAALILLALLDMLWTTVAVSAGGGPVTSWESRILWSLLRRTAHGRPRQHELLHLGGLVVVLTVFVTWIGLLVLGWALVFSSGTAAVREVATADPASFAERLYFAGYTTATLGNGEFAPGPGLWRQLTYVATFSGLAVATMAITYLVPVTSAVTDRRTLGLQLATLGQTPQQLLVSAWRSGDWAALEHELSHLAPQLHLTGQRHLAYPILHYFHDVDERVAVAVGVPVLDEAMCIMQHGIAEHARANALPVASARAGVESFLTALGAGHIRAAPAAPPVPDLEPLRRAGLPTVSDEEFAAACASQEHRRRMLLGLARDDAWSWHTVRSDAEGRHDPGARHALPSDVDEAGAEEAV